jgi:MFS transporter, putative metabolite:H+ symporter
METAMEQHGPSHHPEAMTTTEEAPWRRAALVNARMDALPRFGLAPIGVVALWAMFFFANYDISVFTITIAAISQDLGLGSVGLGLPVAANLVAYAFGAYLCGHVADRFGRQRGLFLTVLILGIGGILSAFSWDMWSFTVFRFITGGGMGAVLSLSTAYLGELAPKSKRGLTISLIYLAQALIIIPVGFASLPVLGLPGGWRWLLGFGGLVLLVLLAFGQRGLVESPRWLAEMQNFDEAERTVDKIERRQRVRRTTLPKLPPAPVLAEASSLSPVRELLRGTLAVRLTIILAFWFAYYVAFYGFTSYQTLILQNLGIALSDAVFISVFSRVVSPLACVVLVLGIERFERKWMVVVGCVCEAAVLLLMLASPSVLTVTIAISVYIFMVSIVTPPAFTYTAEIFPTRSRGTAAALADGVGHVGGAVAPLFVLPVLFGLGGAWAVILVVIAIAIAAIAMAFGPKTRDRALTEISQ